MKNFRKNSILAVTISVLFLSAIIKTYAVPSTYFTAGQTLDPVALDGTCTPGTCSVYPLSIGDPVGTGDDNSILFVNSDGDLAEDSTNFYFDDSTDILYIDDINLPTTSSSEGSLAINGSRFMHSYGTDNVFLGENSGNYTLTGTDNTFVGDRSGESITSGSDNVMIGSKPTYSNGGVTSGSFNTVVGSFAGGTIGSHSGNTLIGYNTLTDTSSDESIVIGANAVSTASNQLVIGSSTEYVNIAYIGSGITSTSPQDLTITTSGGSGTNIAGADITIAPGKGTGNANGGDIIFSTSDAGASGAILQSLTEKMRLDVGGNLAIGGSNTGDYNLHVEEDARVEIVGSGYGTTKTVFGARLARGTMSDPDPVQTEDILGEFGVSGYKETDFANSATAYVRGVATENFLDTATGTRLEFGTTPNTTTGTVVVMTLDQNGYLGLGDLAPDDLLNLYSTSSNGIAVTAVGADVDPYVKFELVDGTPSFVMGVDDSDGDSFKISTTALGTNDRFIIDSSGNINVGGDGTPGDLFSVGSTSQFQINSSGAITAVTGITTTGGVTIGSAGTGALSVGTTTGVYRTTNAGGNVTPQTVFDVDNSNSTAGSQAYMFDTTNGFVFSAANGVRRIARAAIDITNIVNTAGSETADLSFFTKPSGAAITERMRIDASGEVGIGDTTPDYLLDVENTGVDTDIFALTDSDGACLHNPEAGSETVTCSSDERLKENIVDASEMLPYLMDFQIREYDVRASGDRMMGVIAQEVMDTHPELVRVGGNGFYTVELPSTWQIVKGIQELEYKIVELSSLSLENENSLANILVSWFADAANGIQNIFAKKVTVEELCVEDVCITKQELLEILDNSNTEPSGDIVVPEEIPVEEPINEQEGVSGQGDGGDVTQDPQNNDAPSPDETSSPEGDVIPETQDPQEQTGGETPSDVVL